MVSYIENAYEFNTSDRIIALRVNILCGAEDSSII